MSSITYNDAVYNALTGALDFGANSFKVMLVNSTYRAVADETKKDTHSKRSSVTPNEVSGTGYTAGGVAVVPTVTKDYANNKVIVTFPAVNIPNATLSAEGAVYYRSRGGADTADELVCFNDFGGAIASSGGTYTIGASTVSFTIPL